MFKYCKWFYLLQNCRKFLQIRLFKDLNVALCKNVKQNMWNIVFKTDNKIVACQLVYHINMVDIIIYN